MTFRLDLQTKDRELRRRIETARGLLINVDKKLSDAVRAEINGHYQGDVNFLNEERARLWNQVKESRDLLDEVTVEKKCIFENTGLDYRTLPINLELMPCTYDDCAAWFHEWRQDPPREEIIERLIACGLVDKHPAHKGVTHAAA